MALIFKKDWIGSFVILIFESLFPAAEVQHLDWLFSDHRPIEIHLDRTSIGKTGRYSKPFKFEESWIRYDDCSNIIKNNGDWNNSLGDSLSSNLTCCANVLGQWGKEVFLKRKHRIKACKRALKYAYDNLHSINFDEIHRIEFELDNLLEEEEIYWKQRSRE